MRGRFWRAGALVSGLFLFAGACAPTIGQKTNNAASQTSPSAQTSPSTKASPSSSTGTGNTETPSASAQASPSTAPSKLIIASFSLHVGEVGVAYAPVTVGAAGGTPPYQWSIGGGALPGGLSISSAGTVSGTPTVAGGFNFVVLLKDSAGQAAGVTRSIAIAARLAVSGPCATSCNVEVGCVTVCGHFGSMTGGVGPFTYTLTGGSLPQGMGLSALSLTGAFPPPPAAALFLPWKFAVTVADAFGVTGALTAVYYDYSHIAWTTPSATCAAAVAPFQCATTLSYFGGTPNSTQTVKVVGFSAPLPAGSSFSAVAKGGTVTVSVSTPKVNYFGTVTLVLIDSDPCSTSGGCQSGTATVTIRV